LLLNQLIAKVWDRPRPFETHPDAYRLTKTHDPSFPSDHATAAFAIAFAIYLADRRIGTLFVIVATLIAVGRVVVGAHYPSDVIASIPVALVAAFAVVNLARPLLLRAGLFLERATDPVVAPLHRRFRRRATA
jgi:undecaprenyl-diphosphatase